MKEALLASKCFKALGNALVAIADDGDKEIVFREPSVRCETVVVLKAAAESILQLFFVFVVHCDADRKLGVVLPREALGPSLPNHGLAIDLDVVAICTEALGPDFLIRAFANEANSLVAVLDCRFPWPVALGSLYLSFGIWLNG